MRTALRGSYVDVVFFMGIHEKYPLWFQEELHNNIFMDDHRYTFYVHHEERSVNYYEKTLVEDYTVFLRKPTGEIHVTDYDTFVDLYYVFRNDEFTNSALAALHTDTIEYVECNGGELTYGYPEWFEQFFTESLTTPDYSETIFMYQNNEETIQICLNEDTVLVRINGDTSVTSRCVFLCNRFGEIRGMGWQEFLKYYDPDPAY